jgi:hypothetical protein
MADLEKTATTEQAPFTPTPPENSLHDGDVVIPTGWKYKGRRIGPLWIPWYASPESQLILVAFVCFLCPGECISCARGAY